MKTLILPKHGICWICTIILTSFCCSVFAQTEVEYIMNDEAATRAGATSTNEIPVPPLDFHEYYFSPENIGFSTPQTREFIKYGNHEIDHYNGLLKMDIPLLGYNDRNFNLPMSLKYNSSGFVPSKRPGIVGHNWILNFGGVIRREVKGSPDDVKGRKNTSNYKEYLKEGLLVAIRNGRFRQYTEDELTSFKNIELTDDGPYLVRDLKYDMEPDIFTFSFGKHYGSFTIGNDGKPVMLSGDKQYSIDLNSMAVQNYSLTADPVASEITIKSPDGYTYVFNSLEYSIPCNKYGQKIPVHITAWHLTTITAPNNRNVTFKYELIKSSNQYKLFAYDYAYSIISRHITGEGIEDIHTPTMITRTKESISELIFYPRIKNINIDGLELIKFEYVDMPSFYPDDTEQGIIPFAISSIHYYPDLDGAYRKEEFKYKNVCNGYFFLDTLVTSDNGKYRFTYKHIGQASSNLSLPDPLTISTDHWGFWSGENILAENIKVDTFFNDIDRYRKVGSIEAVSTGLLSKIAYPTGGSTEIKYEQNYYTGFLSRDYSRPKYYYTSTEKQICGGVRVASIKDFDPVSCKSITRTIIYKAPGDNLESGNIEFKPKYKVEASESYTRDGYVSYWVDVIEDSVAERKHVYSRYIDQIYTKTVTMNSVSFNGSSTFNEYLIGYSDVCEYFEDGSYIHYNLSSRKDILDDSVKYNYKVYLPNVLMQSYLGSSLNKLEQAEFYNLYTLNDLSRFRGKLLKKTLYSALNQPVSETIYSYNIDDAKNSSVIAVRSGSRGLASYRIFLRPCLLTKTEEKLFSTNGTIAKVSNFKYNQQNQLSEIHNTNSDGCVYSTKYEYVSDCKNPDNAEKLLLTHNMMNSITKITKTKDSETIDGLKFKYIIKYGMPLPGILSRTMPEYEYPIETYHKYDGYGNPIYITTKDNISTVILWGYRGLYPVADIKNATYDEVAKALGITPESLSEKVKPDIGMLCTLQSRLPRSLVTIYEHIPYVGTKAINKYGITDYYEYDSFGRLQTILDDAGHPVNDYQYHYFSN